MRTYQHMHASSAVEAVINILIVKTAVLWIPVGAVVLTAAWITAPSDKERAVMYKSGHAGYTKCYNSRKFMFEPDCNPRLYDLIQTNGKSASRGTHPDYLYTNDEYRQVEEKTRQLEATTPWTKLQCRGQMQIVARYAAWIVSTDPSYETRRAREAQVYKNHCGT